MWAQPHRPLFLHCQGKLPLNLYNANYRRNNPLFVLAETRSVCYKKCGIVTWGHICDLAKGDKPCCILCDGDSPTAMSDVPIVNTLIVFYYISLALGLLISVPVGITTVSVSFITILWLNYINCRMQYKAECRKGLRWRGDGQEAVTSVTFTYYCILSTIRVIKERHYVLWVSVSDNYGSSIL